MPRIWYASINILYTTMCPSYTILYSIPNITVNDSRFHLDSFYPGTNVKLDLDRLYSNMQLLRQNVFSTWSECDVWRTNVRRTNVQRTTFVLHMYDVWCTYVRRMMFDVWRRRTMYVHCTYVRSTTNDVHLYDVQCTSYDNDILYCCIQLSLVSTCTLYMYVVHCTTIVYFIVVRQWYTL